MHNCAGRAAPPPPSFVLFLSCVRAWKSSAVRAQLRTAPRRRSTISISRSRATSSGRSTERNARHACSLSHAALSLFLLDPTHSRVVSRLFGGGASSCSRRATSSVFLPAGPQHASSRFHSLIPSRSVFFSPLLPLRARATRRIARTEEV